VCLNKSFIEIPSLLSEIIGREITILGGVPLLNRIAAQLNSRIVGLTDIPTTDVKAKFTKI
jgi:hypothetical protein